MLDGVVNEAVTLIIFMQFIDFISFVLLCDRVKIAALIHFSDQISKFAFSCEKAIVFFYCCFFLLIAAFLPIAQFVSVLITISRDHKLSDE